MTTYDEAAVTEAAILILQERHNFHKAEANRAITYMTYMGGSADINTDNRGVELVEQVCRESNTELAIFHRGEQTRFAAALESLGVDVGTPA